MFYRCRILTFQAGNVKKGEYAEKNYSPEISDSAYVHLQYEI
jgi:hypothetical protein